MSVFSEYELREMAVKFKSEESYVNADCVGSCEEEMETKVVSKSCRGVVVKETVKGTGKGTLKLSMHMPYEIFKKAYGMELNTLKEGVIAYGQNSRHEAFSITQHVFDEDGNEKFKAYPNAIIKTGIARKIENGAEEVAEVELEVSVMPDEDGNGMYEALASELKDEAVKTTWMNAFTPELVKVVSA
jgi:hypothetical protein